MRRLNQLWIAMLILFLFGCQQYIEVNKLTDRLHENEVFRDVSTANSAILGLYQNLRGTTMIDNIIVDNALVSGEVLPYGETTSSSYYTNRLDATDTALPWARYYSIIYKANRAIESLSVTTDLPASSRDRFLGESLFIRAFSHFMLANFYGDIPLILTSDVEANRVASRQPVAKVYEQLVTDLKEAQALLQSETATDKGRAGYPAATALLARVYLYQQDFRNAELEADRIIQSGLYELLQPGGRVFQTNSKEAIWQWVNNTTQANTVASRYLFTSAPAIICTDFLLEAFEEGDVRKETWIRTTPFGNGSVSIPFKFTSAAAGTDECYTAIRLAEVYLIRAEARMMQEQYESGIEDINLIRARHGGLLNPLPAPSDRESAMTIVLQQRRVELFTEGAHRWFDLKRTGRLDATMAIEKPTTWNSWAALYPILYSDIQQNPNLTQNPNYD